MSMESDRLAFLIDTCRSVYNRQGILFHTFLIDRFVHNSLKITLYHRHNIIKHIVSEKWAMRFLFHLLYFSIHLHLRGPGWLNELPNNSHKPITNTAWVRTRLCKLQKRVHSTRSRK